MTDKRWAKWLELRSKIDKQIIRGDDDIRDRVMDAWISEGDPHRTDGECLAWLRRRAGWARAQAARQRRELLGLDDDAATAAAQIAVFTGKSSAREDLEEAVRLANERLRQVIRLVLVDEIGLSEAAKKVGISPGYASRQLAELGRAVRGRGRGRRCAVETELPLWSGSGEGSS